MATLVESYMDRFSDRGSIPLASTSSSTSRYDGVDIGEQNLQYSVAKRKRAKSSSLDLTCSFSHYQELLNIITVSTKREKINAYKSNVDLVTNFLPHLDIQAAFHIK